MASIKITLAVDRSRNRVLFADAGSDFVDVLLSFLTLPLSALHFCGTQSPGCLSNLSDSVDRLGGSKLLKVEACHGMLLTPSTAHELGRICHDFDTFVKNQPDLQVDGKLCRCWVVIARLVYVFNRACSESGTTFLRGKERFVISNNLTIKPASTSTMLSLAQKFRSESSDAIFHGFEEVEVCVCWSEVVSILKASLSSDTILTDVFLPKGTDDKAARVTVKPSTDRKFLHRSNKDSCSSPERKIKLFYDRQEKKVMYAECKREFVDLLLGFLIYPLGCVIMNTGTRTPGAVTCHLGCSFDNLYRSAVEIDAAGFIAPASDRFRKPIKMLLNPSLGPFSYNCHRAVEGLVEREELYMSLAPYRYTGGSNICERCYPDLVEDCKYIVGDDLLVHQASAMSVAKHWYMRDEANVVEMDVTVRKPEAVELLRAMLTSKTALTDVFIGRLEEEEPPSAMSL